MGMDVNGKNPTAPEGKYFRNSVWSWHPLADYITTYGPDVIHNCEYWDSNDGDGLDAQDAITLADWIDGEIASGRTAAYAAAYKAKQKAAPDKECHICGGTGKRASPPQVGPGQMPCNGCESTGKVRPWFCNYPFSVENVAKFSRFIRHSGGFEIC